MINIKPIIILFSFLFIFNVTFGQISTEFQQVIPKSPTAEEFKRQVDFPVGYYTGIPDISFNLFGISLDKKEINISLSYLAGGIQVDQRATWVGLGWSLNAGGAIIRNVRGGADDNDNNYFGYSSSEGHGSELEYFLNLDKTSRTNMTSSEVTFTENFRRYSANGLYDTEPDIYTFNAIGLTGKFIIDFNGEIVSISHQDYKISGSPLTGFEIIDQFGFVFKFNAIETITSIQANAPELDEDTFNSSWFLTELISPNGNKVSFAYIDEFTTYDSPKSSTHTYYPVLSGCSEFFKSTTSFSNIDSNNKKLSRIDFNEGYILFNATTNREDLLGGKRLDNIEIYDLLGKLVKKYGFDYDYFYGGSGNNDYNSKRLKLLKLNDLTGIPIKSHQFIYEDEDLPNVGSYAKDYWGYYNGEDNNNSPIPNVQDGYYEVINPYNNNIIGYYLRDDSHTNANRNPSIDHIKAGILKEVIYPAGGKTTYDYELNNFNFRRQNTAISGVSSSGEYTYINIARAIAASEPFSSDTQYDNSSYGDVVYGDLEERYVDFTASSSGEYRIQYLLEGATGNETGSSITLLNGSVELFKIQNGNFPLFTNFYNINLIEGTTYTLRAMVDDDERRSVILIAKKEQTIEVDENGNPINISPITGGLRISEIKKFDDNDNLVLKRTYDYKEADNQTSSGVVMNSDIPFFSGLGNGIDLSSSLPCAAPFRVSSNSLISYGTTKGSNVGYKRVTENFIDFKENKSYKNLYEYTSAYDFPTDDIEFFNQEGGASDYNIAFPFTQNISNDFRRGLLKRKTSYDENSTKVFEIINNYQYNIDSLNTKIYGAHFAFNSEGDESEFANLLSPNPFLLVVDYIEYTYDKIYRANKSSEVSNSYLNDEILSTTTNYFYEKPLSNILTRTETTNSKNETLITKIYYADDKMDITGLTTEASNSIDGLLTQHRIAEPIQFTINQDGLKISTTRANFKDWGLNASGVGNMILPEFIQTSKNSDALEDKRVYHTYDAKGNPLEVSQSNGVHTVYIWGYNNQYPIAKIENITYSEVSNQVPNLQSISNLDDDSTLGILGNEGNLRSALTALRNSLPNAQVTTFTYNPLIGITSITDPRGFTIYYEYDDFNRLKQVKDAEGNIVSKNEYNYKIQP